MSGLVTQLAEYRTFNPGDVGSSPTGPSTAQWWNWDTRESQKLVLCPSVRVRISPAPFLRHSYRGNTSRCQREDTSSILVCRSRRRVNRSGIGTVCYTAGPAERGRGRDLRPPKMESQPRGARRWFEARGSAKVDEDRDLGSPPNAGVVSTGAWQSSKLSVPVQSRSPAPNSLVVQLDRTPLCEGGDCAFKSRRG